jgi:hypothetical protein
MGSARPGDPSRGLIQWVDQCLWVPRSPSPSRDMAESMAAGMRAMAEVIGARMSEINAAFAAGLSSGGARADRGDPTGDGPISG